MIFRRLAVLSILGSVLFPALPAHAVGGFSDVPLDHPAAAAVEYLQAKGLISGYADGTFRPNQKVNRAEAVKLIVSTIADERQLKEAGTSSFADVASDAWYAPHVAFAKKQGFVSGTNAGFMPGKAVTKAEFLKMLFLSRKIDLKTFGDVTVPIALDVTNAKDWYYPVMRYALSTGITVTASSGHLSPERELTRSDVAIFLHRFFISREGGKTSDLLESVRIDLERTITALERGDANTAERTAARAVLAARGAHLFQPDLAAVRVAIKTSEGYRALVYAYRAGLTGDLQKVVTHATNAWKSGEAALKISPDAAALAQQLQKYAKSFADQARANMK